ncbi:MAG: hypothetical protein Q9183_006770, partial [Haloplaca sp. 2 TL-2023]
VDIEDNEFLVVGREICAVLDRATFYSQRKLDDLWKKPVGGLLDEEFISLLAEQNVHRVEAEEFMKTIRVMSGLSLETGRSKLMSLRQMIERERRSRTNATLHFSNVLTRDRLGAMTQDGIPSLLTQLQSSDDLLPSLNKFIEVYNDRALVDIEFKHLLIDMEKDSLGSSTWRRRVEHLMQSRHKTCIIASLRSMLSSLTAAKDFVAEYKIEALETQQRLKSSRSKKMQQVPESQVTAVHRPDPFNKSGMGNIPSDRIGF